MTDHTRINKLNLSLLLKTWHLSFNILIKMQKHIKNLLTSKKDATKKNQKYFLSYTMTFIGWNVILMTAALVSAIPQQILLKANL